MAIGEGESVGLLADLEACLQERRNKGTIRSLPKASSWASGLIDFSSNDYLSLARSEDLQREVAAETKQQCEGGHPLGSTGSRLLTGNSGYYELIEQEIAQYHNGETALLFNSGYALNIGFFGSVPMAKHTVFYDEFIHNSVREGMKLCRAKCVSFKHNSVDDLRKKLEACPPHTAIVAVESVYSMDGDCAPIKEMCEVCEQYGAAFVVDEAHSLGLYGPQGIGLVSQLQLEKRVFCTMNPFGKSLGTQGGVIIGPPLLREYLVNYARSFIYSTAMPVSTLAAIRCGYRHMVGAHEARKTLMGHIALFQDLISKIPVSRIESDSAIQGELLTHRCLRPAQMPDPPPEPGTHTSSYQSTNPEDDGRQLAQCAISDIENVPAVLSFLSRHEVILAPFTTSLVELLEHAAPSTYYVLVRVLMHVATFAFTAATEPWMQSVECLTSSLLLCVPFVGPARPAYHQLLLVCQQLLLPNYNTHTWLAPLLRNVASWVATNHLVSHVLMPDTTLSAKNPHHQNAEISNDDASENQAGKDETGQLEKMIVGRVCAQVPQSLPVVAMATGGLASLRARGFRETYTPDRELESVCAVFELPKTDPGVALTTQQRDACDKAVRQLTAVGGDAVSRVLAKTAADGANDNLGVNGVEGNQSDLNDSQHTATADGSDSGPTGTVIRELWLELITDRVGPARMALPTRLGQNDAVGCGLLRGLLCYSLVTMRDPACILPSNAMFPPIDGGLVLQELNTLYAMQPMDSNQYWPDAVFSNLIDLVVDGGDKTSSAVANGDDLENGLVGGDAAGRDGKQGRSTRSWFERLPASVWEQDGDHSVTWLLFKAALKSQMPKIANNAEGPIAIATKSGLPVPEIVRECVSGNCPDLHARVFLEFRQWRAHILETYESKLRVSGAPSAAMGAGEREAGLQRMNGFVSCLGEDGVDEVMALVVDNNKKFPAVGRYLTLYEKGEYSSLPDNRKRTAEDASIMSDTSASPWATPVPKRERLSSDGYNHQYHQRGSWADGMPGGPGGKGGSSHEVNAMVGAMAPRSLRGHIPNNREQLDKEVSDGVATWTRLQRRAPRQFDRALRALVSTYYPAETHRLLDHVLAAFALSGPEQASLVAEGLVQLVNRGARSFRKHPPFYAILSRFNRKSASHPAVCHAFLDVFVSSGSRARHSAFITDCLLSATLEYRQEFLRNLVHAACLECASTPPGGGGGSGEMAEQLLALMHEEERNRGSGRFRDIIVPLLIQEELKGLPEGCPVGMVLRRLGAAVTTYFSQPFSSDVQSTVELLFRPPTQECDTVRICSLIDALLGVLTSTIATPGQQQRLSLSQGGDKALDQSQPGIQEPLHLLVRGSETGGSPLGTRWYRDYFVPCALHSISAVPQAAHLLRLTLSRPALFSALHPRSPSSRVGLRHLVSSIQQTCSDAELGRIVHLWEGCWQGGPGGQPIPWPWLHTLLDVLTDCGPALSSMATRLFGVYVTQTFSLPAADEATWGASLSSVCDYLCGTVEHSGPYSSLFLHVCRHAASLPVDAPQQRWFVRCLSRAVRRLSRTVTSPDFYNSGLAYRHAARTGIEMLLLAVTMACGEKTGPLYDIVCGLFDQQACQSVFSIVAQRKDGVSVRMALEILLHVVSIPPPQATSNDINPPAVVGTANACVNRERAAFWTQSRLSVMVDTLITTEAPEVQEKTEALLGLLITNSESAAQQFVGCALTHLQQNSQRSPSQTAIGASRSGAHVDRIAPLLELAAHHHPSVVQTVVSSVRSLLFVSPAGTTTQTLPNESTTEQSAWRPTEADPAAGGDKTVKSTLVLAGPSVLMLHVLARMWVQAPPTHPVTDNNNPTPMDIDGGKNSSDPTRTDPKVGGGWAVEAEAAMWEALDGMGWNGLEASIGQLELAHCCLQNSEFRSRLARDHLGALVAATGSPGKGTRDLAAAILCQLVAGGDACERRLGREFAAQMRGKRPVDVVFMRKCVGALGLVLP